MPVANIPKDHKLYPNECHPTEADEANYDAAGNLSDHNMVED